MDIIILINQILILFFVILLGYILRKKKIINGEVSNSLSRMLVEVIMPALIINSIINIRFTEEILRNVILMALISFLSYLLVILISEVFSFKLNKKKTTKSIFKFLIIFGNVAYMGIPVISVIFPPEAILYTIINNIVFNIFIWTYGVQILSIDQKKNEKKVQWNRLINAGTIALMIGFFLLVTKINLGPIFGAIEIVSEMTFPLSMLIIGSSLTNVDPLMIFKDRYVYYLILLKLCIIPLIGLILLKLTPLPEMLINVSIVLLAMPSGANSVIFAEKYDSDYIFASKGVFLTTLLALFTIPLFIWLITIY